MITGHGIVANQVGSISVCNNSVYDVGTVTGTLYGFYCGNVTDLLFDGNTFWNGNVGTMHTGALFNIVTNLLYGDSNVLDASTEGVKFLSVTNLTCTTHCVYIGDVTTSGGTVLAPDEEVPLFVCDAINGCEIIDYCVMVGTTISPSASPGRVWVRLVDKGSSGSGQDKIAQVTNEIATQNTTFTAFDAIWVNAIESLDRDYSILAPGDTVSIMIVSDASAVDIDSLTIQFKYARY